MNIHPNLRLSVLGFVSPMTQVEEARQTHPLRPGNHLRWTFNRSLGFPQEGFDVYRSSEKFSYNLVRAEKDQVQIESRGTGVIRINFHGRPPSFCELHGVSGVSRLFVYDRGRQIQYKDYSSNSQDAIRIEASIFDVIQLFGSNIQITDIEVWLEKQTQTNWEILAHVPTLPEIIRENYGWRDMEQRLPVGLSPQRISRYQEAWEKLIKFYEESMDGSNDLHYLNSEKTNKEHISIHLMDQIALSSMDPYFAVLVGLFFVDGIDFPGLELDPAEAGNQYRYRIKARWSESNVDEAVSAPIGRAQAASLRKPTHLRAEVVPGVVRLESQQESSDRQEKRQLTPPLYRFQVALNWRHSDHHMCEIRHMTTPLSLGCITGVREDMMPSTRSFPQELVQMHNSSNPIWSQPVYYFQKNDTTVNHLITTFSGQELDITYQVRVLDEWGRLSDWCTQSRPPLRLRNDLPLPAPANPRIKIIDINEGEPCFNISWEYPNQEIDMTCNPIRFIIALLPNNVEPSIECTIEKIRLHKSELVVEFSDLPMSVADLKGASVRQGQSKFYVKTFDPASENTLILQGDSPEASPPAMLLPLSNEKAEIILNLTDRRYWQDVGDEQLFEAGKSTYSLDFQVTNDIINLRPTIESPKLYPRFGIYATDGTRQSLVAGPVIAPLFLSSPPESPVTPHPINIEEIGVDVSGRRWIRLEWEESSGYHYQLLRGSKALVDILLERINDDNRPEELQGMELANILGLTNHEHMRQLIAKLSCLAGVRQAFSLVDGMPDKDNRAQDYLPARAMDAQFIYVVRLVDSVGNISRCYAVGVFSAQSSD